MKWVRRARWSLLALVVGAASATAGLAASVTVTSKNLTVFRTCVLTASSATSTSDADTTVKEDGSSTNYGKETTMDVQTRSPGRDHRIYVRFDLTKCNPTIPSSASVGLASLRLYISSLPGSCRTYDLFTVPASWEELVITWNNQPFEKREANYPPSSAAAATATVGPSPCVFTAAGYVIWTVTSDVQKFVSGTATNFGWMIRDSVELSSANVGTFSTKELANLAQSPQLVVNYR
jgi:hypothetical protein